MKAGKKARHLSLVLSVVLLFTLLMGAVPAAAAPSPVSPGGFEAAFSASPEDNHSKPYVRWWVSPGRMEEEITREEIRNFKAGGYGGVELVGLELAKCEMNSYDWNETFYWIFDEAHKQNMKVDVMLTEFWPLSTHRIPKADVFKEEYAGQTSQTMYVACETFEATPEDAGTLAGAALPAAEDARAGEETQAAEELPDEEDMPADENTPANADTAAGEEAPAGEDAQAGEEAQARAALQASGEAQALEEAQGAEPAPDGGEALAAQAGMTHTTAGYVTTGLPTKNGFSLTRYFKLLGVTAARRVGGEGANAVYDPASIVDLTGDVDAETGAVSFTAPEEGTWGIFYAYQQGTGQTLGFGVDTVTIDHLSKAGAKLLTDDFDEGIAAFDTAHPLEEGQLTLAQLYKEAGGHFFADSLELTTRILWTSDFLDEFQARRGYNLAPYLPALYSDSTYNNADTAMPYELEGIGLQVRLDYGQTVSELLAENNIKYIRDWAKESFGMGLRYQVHSSAGKIYFDQTLGCIETDIPETESYALGNSLDQYRRMSGVTHMKNSLYTAEAAESSGSSWRETWTGANNQNGVKGNQRDHGFLSYMNRLFASGVNKIIFHGTSAKLTDFSEQPAVGIPSATPSWPGYSLMAGMQYGNEWDDKTPMWAHVNVMTDYLNRTQMTLQQGQGDIDLAFYKVYTTMSDSQAGPWEVNQAGYTFDYVSEAVLGMGNAVTGQQDGQVVLAPDGPSYKALVIDQFRSGANVKPYTMNLETAEKILDWARAGLPIVLIGDAPAAVGSFSGCESAADLAAKNAELAAVMEEINAYAITVADRSALVSALESAQVLPDAKPGAPSSSLFYHRTTEEAEFYFIANDSATDAVSQSVSFKGEGKPYLLDAWSGEITPVARYTAGGGAVTMDIELAPEGQMLVAIAKDGLFSRAADGYVTATDADSVVYDGGAMSARTTAAGTYSVTFDSGETARFSAPAAQAPLNLADGVNSWSLVVNKWQPLNPETPDDPADNNFLKIDKVDSETFTLTELQPWYAIDASLEKAGGVGTYTTRFQLEEGWAQGQGALLSFAYVSDVMRVFVNGSEVHPNQIEKTADIGPYLVAGENTLEVRVSSNLSNYKFGHNAANTFQFGIVGDVIVTPYRQTAVAPDYAVTVTGGTADKARARQGETVRVSADVPAGKVFDKWSSDGVALTDEQQRSNPMTFTMPKNNVTLTAAFQPKETAPAAVPVASLTVTPAAVTLAAGETAVLKAEATPANASDKTVAWASSNSSVATVDTGGRVTALKAGRATITATANDGNGAAASAEIVVRSAPASRVSFPQSSITLMAKKSITLPAIGYAADGSKVKLTYKSAKPKVATVSAKGRISARTAGTTVITATAENGKKATLRVTVLKRGAKVIRPTRVTAAVPKQMKVGATKRITGKYSPARATGVRVTYSSSRSSVLSVDRNGMLVAKRRGTAVITVKAGKVSRKYRVTVR